MPNNLIEYAVTIEQTMYCLAKSPSEAIEKVKRVSAPPSGRDLEIIYTVEKIKKPWLKKLLNR